jgi:hypothetical protein
VSVILHCILHIVDLMLFGRTQIKSAFASLLLRSICFYSPCRSTGQTCTGKNSVTCEYRKHPPEGHTVLFLLPRFTDLTLHVSPKCRGKSPIDIHPLTAPSYRPDYFVCYSPHGVSALLNFYPHHSVMPYCMDEWSLSLHRGSYKALSASPVNINWKVGV